jgi:hypothetical protein
LKYPLLKKKRRNAARSFPAVTGVMRPHEPW